MTIALKPTMRLAGESVKAFREYLAPAPLCMHRDGEPRHG